MSQISRHDAITLLDAAKAEEFERFVEEELFPYFRERFRGPTRVSRADLLSQALLRGDEQAGSYVWVTMWDGSVDAVRGRFFENARMMGRIEETDAILEKLDSFAERGSEHVMRQLFREDVHAPD